MNTALLLAILGISALVQAGAVGIALHQIKAVSGPYRLAWGCVSMALVLMIERRIAPLWRMLSGNEQVNPADAWFGLVISLLMLFGILGIRRLFIDMKDQEARLDALARTDTLTGLPNRRETLERLRVELERSARSGHPVAVFMFDIDHFKRINDAWGHAAGDRVLVAVAQAARACLRHIDSCGRIGGEEFLVILPETAREEAQAAAERLRAALANQAIDEDGQPLRATVSVGVAIQDPADPLSPPDLLIQRADHALYVAKESGRNRVVMA